MSFESELDQWAEELKVKVSERTKQITATVFRNLVVNSPLPGSAPYSVGSYVLSHRISADVPDISTTNIEGEDYSAPEKAIANEVPKLQTIQPFADILISNSIEHNMRVEVEGWSGGKTPPYQTFMKTENTMDLIAEQMLVTI